MVAVRGYLFNRLLTGRNLNHICLCLLNHPCHSIPHYLFHSKFIQNYTDILQNLLECLRLSLLVSPWIWVLQEHIEIYIEFNVIHTGFRTVIRTVVAGLRSQSTEDRQAASDAAVQ